MAHLVRALLVRAGLDALAAVVEVVEGAGLLRRFRLLGAGQRLRGAAALHALLVLARAAVDRR